VEELTTTQWAVGILAALLVGFSKTGMPGLGILIVPMLANIFPEKASVGALLPMLIVGDLFAVAWYRQHAEWRRILPLVPAVAAGVALAAVVLSRVDNRQLGILLGVLVLAMIALEVKRRYSGWHHLPSHPLFVQGTGLATGFGTTMGNVAGPVMNIYLLAHGLGKQAFMGTNAWFFLLTNCSKIPIFVWQDMITARSLRFNLAVTPVIILGAFVGRAVLPHIPQKVFYAVILTLSAAAAIKLIAG